MNNKNVLVVLSGPSGVGKGTIAKLLIERNDNLSLSISCTTRKPREGEVDGREYFFIEKDNFKNKRKENTCMVQTLIGSKTKCLSEKIQVHASRISEKQKTKS